MSQPIARVASLKRRILFATAALVAALAASIAQAPPAAAYEITVEPRSYTYGDCTLHLGMQRWAYGTYVKGYGQATCKNVKTRTAVTVTLKKNSGAETSANSTVFTNSFGMGTRWLLTGWMSGCGNYQAVMHVTIAPWAPTFVTTGAPVSICNRSAKSAHKRPPAVPKGATTRAPV